MTRRFKHPTYNATRIKSAIKAINQLGGPRNTAHLISEISGLDITRERVQAWKKYGIAPPWHPIVHSLTRIPLTELDPEIYPAFIFNQ